MHVRPKARFPDQIEAHHLERFREIDQNRSCLLAIRVGRLVVEGSAPDGILRARPRVAQLYGRSTVSLHESMIGCRMRSHTLTIVGSKPIGRLPPSGFGSCAMRIVMTWLGQIPMLSMSPNSWP